MTEWAHTNMVAALRSIASDERHTFQIQPFEGCVWLYSCSRPLGRSVRPCVAVIQTSLRSVPMHLMSKGVQLSADLNYDLLAWLRTCLW